MNIYHREDFEKCPNDDASVVLKLLIIPNLHFIYFTNIYRTDATVC
jgi:hypothetical protein